MHSKLKGFLALLLAALAFGSFGVWIRLLSADLSTFEQIVLRNAFALLFALGIFLFRFLNKSQTKTDRHVSKKSLIFYTLVVPISVIFYNLSVQNNKIAVTTFAFYTANIICSYIIGGFFYREKLDRIRKISLVISLTGLVFLAYPFSWESLNWGLLAGLISGMLDAVANGFRKNLAGRMDKFILVLLTAIGGIIVSGILIFSAGQNFFFFPEMQTGTWIIGAFFGFLLVAVNYLLLAGFQKFDVSLGTVVLSTELFFASLFGLVVLHEVPSATEAIGGLLVLVAMVLPNLPKKYFSAK